MTGAMSRTKGQAGEREVVAIVRELTNHNVCRRVRQHAGDADLEGLPGWSIEVKRHATTPAGKVAEWWLQTCRQAEAVHALPLLFYRADRATWRCVWPADLHIPDKHKRGMFRNIETTLTAEPLMWHLMVRGLQL